MKNKFSFLILSLALIFICPNFVLAQKKNRITQKADQAFDVQMYYEASELYKKAFDRTKNKAIKSEILFKRAECYRLMSKTKLAANFYKKAINAKYNNSDAIAILRYAEMLMANGNYEKALVQFQKYSKKVPTDTKGEKGIKSCEYAIEWLETPTRYVVEKMDVINSKFSDYSPSFGNEDYSKIYFVSSRKGPYSDDVDERTGNFFTDIYSSSLDKKGKWRKPEAVAPPINSEAHEGTLCLNSKGTTMFFTTCGVENKKALGCDISISQLKGKIWSSVNKLQVKIDSNVDIGHPAISHDENTIIFSSNMPGGYGGKDLWIITKWSEKDGGIVGQWSEPANLGAAVNTAGDELFPFLRSDGSLYFSSDGHVGMGGLDIYKAELNENGQYTDMPINLKYPINSSSDDFGMIVERDNERGYLTSNRKSYIDQEGTQKKLNGSDNIFQFELPPLILTLQGVILNEKTGAIITGADVKIVGDDKSALSMKTDNTGSYNFELNPLTTYEVVVNAEDYESKITSVTTVGITENTDLIEDINLTPIKKITFPVIRFDFARSELRDKSMDDLDSLVITLDENPNITIQLQGHADDRGTNAHNISLSKRRAQECIQYLVSMGIDKERLSFRAMGESVPYVMEEKDGKLKKGDVLTPSYISKFKFKKNREKAHQYNRRTTIKVLSEDYVPKENK